ncbi:MAG TPA: porin [Burkholderiaceae bacterium]|nr:porin [Burkholderiaceae bacterium]
MKVSSIATTPLTAVGVAALLSATAGSALAFEAKISGHVNRMIVSVDDGTQSETFHADNMNSQTRFRFTGTREVVPGLTAGVNCEVGFSSNPSSEINMTTRSVDGTFKERHVEAFLTGNWGKLSLGQGDGAANSAMEVHLSGTSYRQYLRAKAERTAEYLEFRESLEWKAYLRRKEGSVN